MQELPKITSKRADGNTTRLADYYIQKLFKDGAITVTDHFNNSRSNDRLARIITDRLHFEHRNTFTRKLNGDGTILIKLLNYANNSSTT